MLTKSEMGGFSGVPSASRRHYPERARVGVSYHSRTLPRRIPQCYRGCNVVARGWDNDSTSLFAGLFWALRLGDGWYGARKPVQLVGLAAPMPAHRAREMGSIGVGPPNALVKRPKLRRAGARFLLGRARRCGRGPCSVGTEAWARFLRRLAAKTVTTPEGLPCKGRDHTGGPDLARTVTQPVATSVRFNKLLGGPD